MAPLPWVGGYNMIGDRESSGQFEHGQLGATNQRSKENYQTKPIPSNPWGINGLQRVPMPRTARLGKTRRIAPLRLQTDLRLRAGREEQQQGDDYRGRGNLPSNGTTKQTQFPITGIDRVAYKRVRRCRGGSGYWRNAGLGGRFSAGLFLHASVTDHPESRLYLTSFQVP